MIFIDIIHLRSGCSGGFFIFWVLLEGRYIQKIKPTLGDDYTMLTSFVLTLREGMEAALIIGMLIGILRKINQPGLSRAVWSGVISAVLVAFVTAVALN